MFRKGPDRAARLHVFAISTVSPCRFPRAEASLAERAVSAPHPSRQNSRLAQKNVLSSPRPSPTPALQILWLKFGSTDVYRVPYVGARHEEIRGVAPASPELSECLREVLGCRGCWREAQRGSWVPTPCSMWRERNKSLPKCPLPGASHLTGEKSSWGRKSRGGFKPGIERHQNPGGAGSLGLREDESHPRPEISRTWGLLTFRVVSPLTLVPQKGRSVRCPIGRGPSFSWVARRLGLQVAERANVLGLGTRALQGSL